MAVTHNKIFLALADAWPHDDYVAVLGHDGNFLQRWGGWGKGRSQFEYISGVAVYDRAVFVTSQARLQAFRADGSLLWLNEMDHGVFGKVVATDNLLFLANTSSATIVALSHEGQFRFQISLKPFALHRLIGVSANELLVGVLPAKIHVLAVTDGTALRRLALPRSAEPLEISPHGLVLCSNALQHVLCTPDMRVQATTYRGWMRLAAFTQTQQFWLWSHRLHVRKN